MTKSSLHNKQSNNFLLEEVGEAGYHVPVLMHEALDALQINAEGVYVDCTFGGGGHSKAILEKLGKNGKLIAFDQDEDAGKNLPKDERIIFVPNNFRHLQRFLRLHKHPKVDGILADLGVSSHQFNEAARGFSIRFNGPLDMRMNVNQEMTAADILLRYSEQQLHQLFGSYGEVTNAKTLAKHIVQYRQKAALNSIEAFKQLIAPVVKGNPNKYLAQVFQALRIEVNDELGALKELLEQTPGCLKEKGRVVMITFHSLEDRLVKHFFKRGTFEEEKDDNPFLMNTSKNELKIITKKPVIPSAEEQKRNPRSRSAKLRAAEKMY